MDDWHGDRRQDEKDESGQQENDAGNVSSDRHDEGSSVVRCCFSA